MSSSWAEQAEKDKDRWADLEAEFPECRHETPILMEQLLQLLSPLKGGADLFLTDAAVYVGMPKAIVTASTREHFGGRYTYSRPMLEDPGPFRFAFEDMADVRIEEKRRAVWLTVETSNLPERQWLKIRSTRFPGWSTIMQIDARNPLEEVWHRFHNPTDRPPGGFEETGSQEPAPTEAADDSDPPGVVAGLAELIAMKEAGHLTEDEFAEAKKRLLT